jgi:hypothetical protein
MPPTGAADAAEPVHSPRNPIHCETRLACATIDIVLKLLRYIRRRGVSEMTAAGIEYNAWLPRGRGNTRHTNRRLLSGLEALDFPSLYSDNREDCVAGRSSGRQTSTLAPTKTQPGRLLRRRQWPRSLPFLYLHFPNAIPISNIPMQRPATLTSFHIDKSPPFACSSGKNTKTSTAASRKNSLNISSTSFVSVKSFVLP